MSEYGYKVELPQFLSFTEQVDREDRGMAIAYRGLLPCLLSFLSHSTPFGRVVCMRWHLFFVREILQNHHGIDEAVMRKGKQSASNWQRTTEDIQSSIHKTNFELSNRLISLGKIFKRN